MKVMKTDEWKFMGVQSESDRIPCGFLFQNRKYKDYVIVRAAKYIVKSLGIVLFLTFSSGVPQISISHSAPEGVVEGNSYLNGFDELESAEKLAVLESLADDEVESTGKGMELPRNAVK